MHVQWHKEATIQEYRPTLPAASILYGKSYFQPVKASCVLKLADLIQAPQRRSISLATLLPQFQPQSQPAGNQWQVPITKARLLEILGMQWREDLCKDLSEVPGVHPITLTQLKFLQQQPIRDIKEWHIYVDGSAKATTNGIKTERVAHPHWSVVIIGLCRDNEGNYHYQHHSYTYGSVC